MTVRSWQRRRSLSLLFGGVCLVGGACGGAASHSAASSTTGAPGSGSGSSSSTSRVPSGTVDGLDQAKLAGLQNYTFTSVNSYGSVSMTWTGRVHGPTDWEVTTNAPAVTTYDVAGHGSAVAIGRLQNITFETPEGVNHLFGEAAFAEQLFGYTHVAGIRIARGGPCSVAGASGAEFVVQAPNASIVNETARACVERSNGALLSYQAGVSGGSAANAAGLSGHGTTFTVSSIGGVGPISAPAAPSS